MSRPSETRQVGSGQVGQVVRRASNGHGFVPANGISLIDKAWGLGLGARPATAARVARQGDIETVKQVRQRGFVAVAVGDARYPVVSATVIGSNVLFFFFLFVVFCCFFLDLRARVGQDCFVSVMKESPARTNTYSTVQH